VAIVFVAQKLRYILDADRGQSIFRRLLLSPKGAVGESNKVVEAPFYLKLRGERISFRISPVALCGGGKPT